MAKIFKLFKNFLLNIWYFRRDYRIKSINNQLKNEIVDQEKNRKEFLHELQLYMRKYLRKDASGKYIPLSGKNKAEIYTAITIQHGARMKELNITFTKNLQIKL